MAPEVLGKRIALNEIDSHVKADIYSYGLVLWELCMGTSIAKELPKEVRIFYLTNIFIMENCLIHF